MFDAITPPRFTDSGTRASARPDWPPSDLRHRASSVPPLPPLGALRARLPPPKPPRPELSSSSAPTHAFSAFVLPFLAVVVRRDATHVAWKTTGCCQCPTTRYDATRRDADRGKQEACPDRDRTLAGVAQLMLHLFSTPSTSVPLHALLVALLMMIVGLTRPRHLGTLQRRRSCLTTRLQLILGYP